MVSATNGRYANGSHNSPMPAITKISVAGIKSLTEESKIEVRPLTILAGANSSGKSSMVQSLLLLKQTLEATYDPGALLLNGPNIVITAIDQLVSTNGSDEDTKIFSIDFGLDTGATLSSEFRREQSQVAGVKLASQTYSSKDGRHTLSTDMSLTEMQEATESLRGKGLTLEDSDGLFIGLDRCFLTLSATRVRTEEEPILVKKILNFGHDNPDLALALRSIIHIPGLRGTRERAYPVTGTGPQFPGLFDFYTASVLFSWQMSQPEKIEKINQDLTDLGLTNRVNVLKLDDTRLEIRVNRVFADDVVDPDDMVNIADVGIGASQVLPLLVGLVLAEHGQMVYIEQPEIHLHPRAQTALAQIIVDAANRGVRVVVETHSSLLLLAIQTLVAEGELSTDKAILHWFERNEDGITQITSSGLDEAGAYGDWPVDFDDVSLNVQSRYLDAAESHYLTQ